MGQKKRNHYIPKFLLKRFAADAAGSSPRVWQYRLGSGPKLVGVSDAGVARYFYGEPENGVEEELSVVESRHSPVIDAVAHGEDPQRFESELAEFAWYMSLRTENIRASFGTAVERGLDGLADTASSDEARAALDRFMVAEFDEMVERTLLDLGLPPAAIAEFRNAYPQLRPVLLNKTRDQLSQSDLGGFFQQLFSSMLEENPLPKTLQRGQVDGMSKALRGAHELDRFAAASWRSVRFRTPGLILGDGVVIAMNGQREFAHPLRFGAEWAELWIPISPYMLLIASREARRADSPALTTVNELTASLSTQCFFASRSSETERALAEQIGTREPGISASEVDTLFRQTWQDM